MRIIFIEKYETVVPTDGDIPEGLYNDVPLGSFLLDFLFTDLSEPKHKFLEFKCKENESGNQLDLIETQKMLANLTDKYLNYSETKKPTLNELTPLQRIFLYRQFEGETSLFSNNLHLSPLVLPTSNIKEIYKIDVNNFTKQDLDIIKKTDFSFCEAYESNSIGSIIYAEIMRMANQNIVVKTCANCKTFFSIIRRSDTIYCDKCRGIGATLVYKKKVREHELLKIYDKEYQRQYAKIRNYDIGKRNFELGKLRSWTEKAKIKMKEPNLTAEAFEKWLNANAVFPRSR